MATNEIRMLESDFIKTNRKPKEKKLHSSKTSERALLAERISKNIV